MRFRIKNNNTNSIHGVSPKFSVKFTRTVQPTREPVTLREAKDFLYIDHSEDDALVFDLIESATEQCEAWTGRSLITQTWKLLCDYFPRSTVLDLRHGPVQSIDAIEYIDEEHVVNEFDVETNVYLTDQHLNGRMVLNNNKSYPTEALRHKNGVEITFTTGYGDQPVNVPKQIRTGILHQVAHTYENREDGGLSPAAIELWAPYKIMDKK